MNAFIDSPTRCSPYPLRGAGGGGGRETGSPAPVPTAAPTRLCDGGAGPEGGGAGGGANTHPPHPAPLPRALKRPRCPQPTLPTPPPHTPLPLKGAAHPPGFAGGAPPRMRSAHPLGGQDHAPCPRRSVPRRAVPRRARGANSLTAPPWLGPGWSSLKGPGRGGRAAGRGCGHGPAPRAPHGAAPCNRPNGRATPERWDHRGVRPLPSRPTPVRTLLRAQSGPRPRTPTPTRVPARARPVRTRPAHAEPPSAPLGVGGTRTPGAGRAHGPHSHGRAQRGVPSLGSPRRRLSGHRTPNRVGVQRGGLGGSRCRFPTAGTGGGTQRDHGVLRRGRRGLSLTYRDRLL